jgi:DNA polymerase-2
VRVPADAPPLRDRLTREGIACYEADVRFAMRYLIDRGIRGALAIEGEGRPGEGIGYVFDDPDVAPAEFTPELSVLSLDIETDPRASKLLAVALHGCGASEVLLLLPPGAREPAGAVPFRSERALLTAFARRVQELDPDVLTGWNVVDFDLSVLDRLANRAGVALPLGRSAGPLRLRRESGVWTSSRATVPGRVVLDGIALLRGAFVKMEEYSLDFVAREVLGEGKLMSGHGRAEEIERTWREDLPRFVAYNLTDARLVLEILDKLHLVELAVERSRLTGMPPDRVAASIASFDFLYLSELARRDVVAPSVRASQAIDQATAGGHVLEPEPGLYRNVLAFDFKSLYPSIIRTLQIDPLGHVRAPGPDDDCIVTPNGASFRRQPGILPGMLDDLFPRREQAKKSGDKVTSQAVKILMNSFYGVLGTPACRFYDPALANAITSSGKAILLWAKGRFESLGHRVLYGDTDSLFVLAGEDDETRARALGEGLVKRINDELTEHVRDTWNVPSKLELEFETLYLRLILLPVRHGTAGARKRYAGLVRQGDETQVVFTGMEVVRRDWTALAKQVQTELYARLFADRPVEEYLGEMVTRLRAGELDDLLVYRKALRKKLGDYTSTTPPHVAAARKMSGDPGRLISYVMTTGGPEPAAERRSLFDHEHYVQKQLRPVSEPVLAILGLDFDKVVGDDTQLDLF